jgi:Undecaprenyl-phosphate galactose phosphotransferase WbaP
MEQRSIETASMEVLLADNREQPSPRKGNRWKQIWKQRLIVATLIVSDVSLAFLMWLIGYAVHSVWGLGPLSEVITVITAASVIVWIGLRALLGLYPGYGLGWVEELRKHTYSVFAAVATTAIFAVALQYEDLLYRWLLGVGFMALLVLAPVARYFTKLCLKKAGAWGKPVVIVSSGESGTEITELMKEKWELGYNPAVGFNYRFAPSRETSGDTFETSASDEITMADAAKLAKCQGIDTVALAMPHTRREQVAKLVDLSSTSFQHVMVILNLAGVTTSAIVARDLAGTLAVEIRHNLLNPWSQRAKRALDLFGAVVGGFLIGPMLLLIAILIKLDSPGPVFYGHQRVGTADSIFRCWKFRTMHKDAESLLEQHLRQYPHLRIEWERDVKLREDPRVTRVGSILRKTSLDELPQLWNVLIGEMSLVGPRPIVREEVKKYGEGYEMYKRVRPGISGLWQVSGRNNVGYAEQVALDSYYVRNWSVWLDLIILARTPEAVLIRRGAY